jgi:hypothetical protein
MDFPTTPPALPRQPGSIRSVLALGLVAGVATGLGVTLLLCVLEWLGRVSLDTIVLVGALFYGWVAVTFVALLGLVSRRFRRKALATLLAMLAAPLAFWLTLDWTWGFRVMALERFVARSQPLVEAIHAHEKRHAEPPPELSALVPEFLAEVPGTGMPVFPEYRYARLDERPEAGALGWTLSISNIGMVLWSQFTYRPDETLDRDDEAFVRRVGSWVLLHHD